MFGRCETFLLDGLLGRWLGDRGSEFLREGSRKVVVRFDLLDDCMKRLDHLLKGRLCCDVRDAT